MTSYLVNRGQIPHPSNWEQGSSGFLDRLFPDVFHKKQFLFQDSKLSNRWSTESQTFKKNTGTKVFPWCTADIQARLIKIWPTQKKFHLLCTCCSFQKKLKTFYHFFKTLFLFSRPFPGLENCWANFKTFPRIQDSVGRLWDKCVSLNQ